MKFQLKKSFQIESARFLPNLPKSHPCAHIHGHSFQVTLVLLGELDTKLGWVIDYNDIQTAAAPVLKTIDHRLLNEVAGLENPTTEMLCAWIYNEMKNLLPQLKQVIIKETADTECAYPAV